MAFDPNSARPIGGSTGFDANTAQPVEQESDVGFTKGVVSGIGASLTGVGRMVADDPVGVVTRAVDSLSTNPINAVIRQRAAWDAVQDLPEGATMLDRLKAGIGASFNAKGMAERQAESSGMRDIRAPESVRNTLESTQQNLSKIAAEGRPESTAGGFAYDVTRGVADLGIAAALTRVTGSPAVGAGYMAGNVAGSSYGDTIDSPDFKEALEGKSEDEVIRAAQNRTAAFGGAEFVTELPVVKLMTTPISLLGGKDAIKTIAKNLDKTFVRRLGTRAGAEGMQEGLTNILQDAYDNAAMGQDKTIGEILQDSAYAAVVGSTVGGIVGIPQSLRGGDTDFREVSDFFSNTESGVVSPSGKHHFNSIEDAKKAWDKATVEERAAWMTPPDDTAPTEPPPADGLEKPAAAIWLNQRSKDGGKIANQDLANLVSEYASDDTVTGAINAIDSVPDAELQKVSPQYRALRSTLSEQRVKMIMKADAADMAGQLYGSEALEMGDPRLAEIDVLIGQAKSEETKKVLEAERVIIEKEIKESARVESKREAIRELREAAEMVDDMGRKQRLMDRAAKLEEEVGVHSVQPEVQNGGVRGGSQAASVKGNQQARGARGDDGAAVGGTGAEVNVQQVREDLPDADGPANANAELTLDEAANQAATSPLNDKPMPTQEQAENGDYEMGKVQVQGMDISIENPRGSVRSGKDKSGKEWSNEMSDHYGFIEGTKARDGEGVDVYVGKGAEKAGIAYVIDQMDPETGKFDEHKVMLGYSSAKAAADAYRSNYDAGWKGIKGVTAVPVNKLKDWLANGDTKSEIGSQGVGESSGITDAKDATGPSKPKGEKVHPTIDEDRLRDAIAKTSVQFNPETAKDPDLKSKIEFGKFDKRTQDAIDKIAKLFGKTVVPYRLPYEAVEGFVRRASKDMDDVIFLNLDMNLPVESVMMHEVLHTIRNQDQDLYNQILKAVLKATDSGDVVEAAVRFAKAEGYSPSDRDNIREEMSADIFSDQATTPKFWADLSKELGQSQFQKLIDAVMRALSKIMSSQPYKLGTDRYLVDHVDAMYRTMVKASAEHIRRQNKRAAKASKAKTSPRSLAKRAYHGSPYKFDRFSLDAIGTGEGAQAYGWGLYFAERRSIAEWYRDVVSDPNPREWEFDGEAGLTSSEIVSRLESELAKEGYSVTESKEPISFAMIGLEAGVPRQVDIKNAESEVEKRAIEILRDRAKYSAVDETPSLYQVDIPEDHELLDWDAPLSEQPEAVLDALHNYVDRMVERASGNKLLADQWVQSLDEMLKDAENVKGYELYSDFSDRYGKGLENPRLASELLGAIGIKGLRYRDNQSRKSLQDPDAPRNYVIWDEDAVTIEAVNDELRQAEVAEEKSLARRKKSNAEVGGFKATRDAKGFLTVYGDVAEIRSKLPDNIKGMPTGDGLRFTPNKAHRAEAALNGEKIAYSRSGKVTQHPKKNGKYIGASQALNTPEKLRKWRSFAKDLVREGEAGRYWYENSGSVVLDMVGGDVAEARKFIALLAIYSPQAKVDANSTFALRAWAQYQAGLPISVKTGVMDKKAQRALDNIEEFWAGEKTGNFYTNLLREVDPSVVDKQGATVDMWVMRAGNYDHDAPNDSEYRFMEVEINRLAEELGWEPQQVQAALWVGMKARMENKGVADATEITSNRRKWIKGYGNKRKILDERKHLLNWIKHAREYTPTEDDLQKAKFDFSDGIRRHVGQISWEAIPSTNSDTLPGIHGQPYELLSEYQTAIQEALSDDSGVDLVAQYLGILADGTVQTPGLWEGVTAPSNQTTVGMAPQAGGNSRERYVNKSTGKVITAKNYDALNDSGKGKYNREVISEKEFEKLSGAAKKDGWEKIPDIDPGQRAVLDLYAAALGLVLKQDMVGYHKPVYGKFSQARENGIEVRVGRPLTTGETKSLSGILNDTLAGTPFDGKIAVIGSPDGVRVVHFASGEDSKPFHKAVESAFESAIDGRGDVYRFAAVTGGMSNDWSKNTNGQDYEQAISGSGRSDLLEWLDDVIHPRVEQVNQDFAERYGWGEKSLARKRKSGGDRGGRASSRSAANRPVPASEQADAQGPLDPLPGAPNVPGIHGPIPGLVSVAEKYAKANGINLTRQSEYVEVDENRAKRIAQAYADMPHAPNDPAVQAAYQDLIRQTDAQYRALVDAGYKFWFIDIDTEFGQDYADSPFNAMRDIASNKRMGVFPTEGGFGSGDTDVDVQDNPLLADTGYTWPNGGPDGKPKRVLANDLFRAVHDAFGHGLEGAGFRARGEENAWQAHVRLFTGPAVGAITSETRGQNSWLNFGPHGDKNRNAKVEDTTFADQKTGLMPEWTWTEGRADDEGISLARKRQTETPEFKRWFGDSKVVDESGEPLVVYHGTQSDISEFSPSRQGTISTFLGDEKVTRFGIFVTPDRELAEEFSLQGKGRNANVMPLYARIESPLDMTNGMTSDQYDQILGWLNKQPDVQRPSMAAGFIRDQWGDWQLFDEDAGNDPEWFIGMLKDLGYDGVKIYEPPVSGEGRDGETYIAFDPTQIKSATGNSGEFDPDNPSILARRKRPDGFYRQLDSVIETDMGGSEPSGQLLQKLDGWIKKGKVKAEEVEWSGLRDWLAAVDRKVTKQEVSQFLEHGGVQVEEVLKGGMDRDAQATEDLFVNQVLSQYGIEYDEYEGGYLATDPNGEFLYDSGGSLMVFDSRGDAEREIGSMAADQVGRMTDEEINERLGETLGQGGPTKYRDYTLEGGENYRELLLTLPASGTRERLRQIEKRFKELDDDLSRGDRSGDDEFRALLAEREALRSSPNTEYRSNHWDEPNVLAHIRFNDRTDADGNAVLFIEEIQSDWHQEGRKKGYGKPKLEVVEKGPNRFEIHGKNGRVELPGRTVAFADRESAQRAIDDGRAHRGSNTGLPGVPDAPFKKTWPDLALKRMIRFAVENGYDKISWAPGQEQADRYDLSKQVESVEWAKYDDERVDIYVQEFGSPDRRVVGRHSMEDLPGVVGKELSDKITAEFNAGSVNGEMRGVDLKIGGEGMKAFYDREIPSRIKKIGKKFGVDIGLSEVGGVTVQSFDITDSLRDQVNGDGFSLFRNRRQGPTATPPPSPSTDITEANKVIRDKDKKAWDVAKDYWRRNFMPGGLLPKQVFSEKILRDNKLNVAEFDTLHLVGSLERIVSKEYGRSFDMLTIQEKRVLQDALTGDISDTIPPKTKAAIIAMRQYIDNLSRDYIQILEAQTADLRADLDEGESLLLDAFMQMNAVLPEGDSAAAKAAATRKKNEILDEAKAGAKEIWGDGKGMQKALSRVADIAEKMSLIRTITGNLGQYVNRSYRAFDDPKWFSRISETTINAARDYLMDRYTEDGMSAEQAFEQANRVLNELKTGTAVDSLEAMIMESKLGAKDLGILKRRKDIAPEIRAFLGEYSDPRLNFSKSVAKMTRLIANQRLLDRILDIGMGSFLWEKDDPSRPAKARIPIAAESSETYSPLNGLHTYPEILQAFKDAMGNENMSALMRNIIQLNGMVKFGKTVLSVTTMMRNWQSALLFALANGHFNLLHAGKSIGGLSEYFTQTGDDQKLEYLRHLKRLGVVYDTAYAGEMMRLMQESKIEDILASQRGAGYQAIRRGLNYATKAYQYGDDFWKIIGYENEKNALIRSGMTKEEAEVEAAERIRNTYPTYSMIGRAVQWLRRFPLAGTFVSFPAEIIRTSANMVELVAKDFKAGRTELAARRAVGLAIVSGLAYAVQKITQAQFGIDDEEDEAIRRMAAPWSKNSNVMYAGRDKDGNVQYFDLSYVDPYNYWKRPITAIFREQPWEDKLYDVLSETLTPFFGTDIAAGAILEVINNKKSTGSPVYEKTADPLDKTGQIAEHLAKALQPGTAGNIQRTVAAMKGEKKMSGQPYVLKDEALAWVGWRATTVDPKTALYYRSFEFNDNRAEAKKVITKVVRNPNIVDDDEVRAAYQDANRRYNKVVQDMILLIKAARTSGMDDVQIYEILTKSGVSKVDAGMLVKGQVMNVRITPQAIKNDAMKAQARFGKDAVDQMLRRYSVVIDEQSKTK